MTIRKGAPTPGRLQTFAALDFLTNLSEIKT